MDAPFYVYHPSVHVENVTNMFTNINVTDFLSMSTLSFMLAVGVLQPIQLSHCCSKLNKVKTMKPKTKVMMPMKPQTKVMKTMESQTATIPSKHRSNKTVGRQSEAKFTQHHPEPSAPP